MGPWQLLDEHGRRLDRTNNVHEAARWLCAHGGEFCVRYDGDALRLDWLPKKVGKRTEGGVLVPKSTYLERQCDGRQWQLGLRPLAPDPDSKDPENATPEQMATERLIAEKLVAIEVERDPDAWD
jgi:hypothetical protein